MRASILLFVGSLSVSSLLGLAAPGAAAHPRVVLETSKGEIVLELYPDKTPATVENFLAYVRDGHYDGTIFYRVTDFLIQAGSTDPDFSRRATRDPVENEADKGLENETGTVGMARWQPHSATAEFYVNTKDNPHLDYSEKTDAGWGYCVFGRVVKGMATVRSIAAVPRGPRQGWQDVPQEEVLIEKAYLAPEGSEAATAPPEDVAPRPAPAVRLPDG
jgi:peptidyl-prolyl cis-trans isomerase B (cyclophilin B)